MKKIVFNVRDDQYEDIKKLMARRNFFNTSETLRYCITQTVERELNNYKEVAKMKINNRLSPRDREAAKLEAQEHREKIKEEKFLESKAGICELLNGKVEEQNGYPVCVFNKYIELAGQAGIEAKVTTIPLENLSEEQVNLQYINMFGQTGQEVRENLINKLKK